MTKAKDYAVLILVVGLVLLLAIMVIGEFYSVMAYQMEWNDQILEILKLSVVGVVGIVSGYVSGKSS